MPQISLKTFYKTALATAALLLLASPQAKAATQALGHFGGWAAYHLTDNNQSVCYMVLSQDFPRLKGMKRSTAHLMITHRPAENTNDVVSYSPGYILRNGSDVKMTIDGAGFDLFSAKDAAWARTPKIDHAIAAAIRQAKSVSIVGTPAQKGIPKLGDQLNIAKADLAYQAISKACGLEKSPPPAPAKAAPPAHKPAAKPHKKHKS